MEYHLASKDSSFKNLLCVVWSTLHWEQVGSLKFISGPNNPGWPTWACSCSVWLIQLQTIGNKPKLVPNWDCVLFLQSILRKSAQEKTLHVTCPTCGFHQTHCSFLSQSLLATQSLLVFLTLHSSKLIHVLHHLYHAIYALTRHQTALFSPLPLRNTVLKERAYLCFESSLWPVYHMYLHAAEWRHMKWNQGVNLTRPIVKTTGKSWPELDVGPGEAWVFVHKMVQAKNLNSNHSAHCKFIVFSQQLAYISVAW